MAHDYNNKKRGCKKRGIEFNFTKAEWTKFVGVLAHVRCAYTNERFCHRLQHSHSPTCERIDEREPYSLHNCVWVTFAANQLKEKYLESSGKTIDMTATDEVYLLKKIVNVISNEEEIQAVKEKYLNLMENPPKTNTEILQEMIDVEDQQVQNADQPKQEKEVKVRFTTVSSNIEVRLAASYVRVCEYFESIGCEFVLTFSQYKRKMNLKNCQLTGSPFGQGSSKVLFLVDKNLPVAFNNVLTTDKHTKQVFDNLESATGMSLVKLKAGLNVLVKE